MKSRGLNQQDLARSSGISQGQISRAIDPSYGNLTLNTIIRLAAGFDVAFVGRFVPFSELARWSANLPNEDFDIRGFDEEDKAMDQHHDAVAKADVIEFRRTQTSQNDLPIRPSGTAPDSSSSLINEPVESSSYVAIR